MNKTVWTDGALSFPILIRAATGKGGGQIWRSVVYCCVYIVVIVASATDGAEPGPTPEAENVAQERSSLAKVFPGLEVVRCVFDEGRVVVRYRGELSVLHSGEQLAPAGLEVADVSGDRIIFESIATKTDLSNFPLPKTIVVLSKDAQGLVDVKVFNADSKDEGMTLGVPSEYVESSVFPIEDAARIPPASGSSSAVLSDEVR